MATPLVESQRLSFFKTFFPSWRFFEFLGEIPKLWIRVGATPETLSDWRLCTFEPKRPRLAGFSGILRLFWNPSGNLAMAQHAALDHWVQELESTHDAPASYRVVEAIARAQAHVIGGRYFQFKITLTSAPASDLSLTTVDFAVSEILETSQ